MLLFLKKKNFEKACQEFILLPVSVPIDQTRGYKYYTCLFFRDTNPGDEYSDGGREPIRGRDHCFCLLMLITFVICIVKAQRWL